MLGVRAHRTSDQDRAHKEFFHRLGIAKLLSSTEFSCRRVPLTPSRRTTTQSSKSVSPSPSFPSYSRSEFHASTRPHPPFLSSLFRTVRHRGHKVRPEPSSTSFVPLLFFSALRYCAASIDGPYRRLFASAQQPAPLRFRVGTPGMYRARTAFIRVWRLYERVTGAYLT
jgi:hypothetical protein